MLLPLHMTTSTSFTLSQLEMMFPRPQRHLQRQQLRALVYRVTIASLPKTFSRAHVRYCTALLRPAACCSLLASAAYCCAPPLDSTNNQPSMNVLVATCGPPAFNDAMVAAARTAGHKREDLMFVF